MPENVDIMLDLSQPDNVRRAQMALVGRKGWHHIVVKQARGTASQQQRGYYFAVVMATYALYLTDYAGWEGIRDADDAHEVAKRVFLSRTITNRDGRTQKIPGSIQGMTTEEMTDHIEQVRRLMDQANYVTPDPDPCWRLGKTSPREGVTAS